jgi:hypothetical protein
MKFHISRRALILVFLFVFSFSLRVVFLSKGPFHIDALDLALSSQKTLETLRLHYEHGTGYPLTVILGSFFILFFKIFGVADPVFCVNVMSAFFGAAGVVLMFLFVERLFDERRALATAVLMACFAPHVAISTFGKSLTLSICFMLAAFYFALRYSREGQRRHLVATGLFLGFCAGSRLSDAIAAVPIIFLICERPGRVTDRLRAVMVFGIFGAATAFLYYVPMLLEHGFTSLAQVITREHEAAFLGFFSFVLKYSFGWLLSVMGSAGALTAISGFGCMLISRRIKTLLFLGVWFFIFQFFYGNVSSSGPRYLVIGWLSILVAQGYFLGMFKGKAFLVSALLLALTAAWPLAQAAPALEFRHRRALQIEFARWVASQTRPQDLIIAVDEEVFIRVYGQRDVLRRSAECDDGQMDQFFAQGVDQALAEGRRVYAIGSASCVYDSCFKFRKRIEKDYERIYCGVRLNEGWHHALLNQNLFLEGLWEIRKK